jgi:hypothetical protein
MPVKSRWVFTGRINRFETGVFMKKNVIYGIIALLSVSLFFLGCPTEASDDTNPVSNVIPDGSAGPDLTSPGAGTAALVDALETLFAATGNGSTVSKTGNIVTVTLGGTENLPDLTVSPGTELVIDLGTNTLDVETINNAGILSVTATGTTTLTVTDPISNTGTLEVGTGVTLTTDDSITNSGTLTVDGNLMVDVSGSIVNNGNIDVNGTYTLTAGATGTNNGKVNIGATAELHAGQDVRFGGNGTNEVQAGGKVYFDDETYPFIGTGSDTDAVFQLTGVGSTFTYNNDQYILNGTATLNDASGNSDADVRLNPQTKLTIKENGVLTIASGAVLALSSCVSEATRPLVGEVPQGGGAAPQVVFSGGGSYFASSSTYRYFYDINDTVISSAGIPAGTYNWDATLNGWKAQ